MRSGRFGLAGLVLVASCATASVPRWSVLRERRVETPCRNTVSATIEDVPSLGKAIVLRPGDAACLVDTTIHGWMPHSDASRAHLGVTPSFGATAVRVAVDNATEWAMLYRLAIKPAGRDEWRRWETKPLPRGSRDVLSWSGPAEAVAITEARRHRTASEEAACAAAGEVFGQEVQRASRCSADAECRHFGGGVYINEQTSDGEFAAAWLRVDEACGTHSVPKPDPHHVTGHCRDNVCGPAPLP